MGILKVELSNVRECKEPGAEDGGFDPLAITRILLELNIVKTIRYVQHCTDSSNVLHLYQLALT